MPTPIGYTRTQIRLHWIIFVLVLSQYIFHEPITKAWELIEKGGAPELSLTIFSHVAGGILIMLLAIWRIRIKMKRGAPALPADESRLQQILAHATHGLLYLLLLAMPLSGMVAYFGKVDGAANAHGVMRVILLVLILLHFVAALYHRFVLKSGVMERMINPEE